MDFWIGHVILGVISFLFLKTWETLINVSGVQAEDDKRFKGN